MFDLELDNGVSRIDVPGGDGGGCNCGALNGVSFPVARTVLFSYLMRCKDIRCNNYKDKKLDKRLTGKAQQIRQKLQPLGPKVPEELEMSRKHGFIQPRQQFQPLRRNPRPYCPPILALPGTG